MMRNIMFMLPIVVFSALMGFFAFRLLLIDRGNTPDIIPSVLIGHPAPEFDLSPLLTDKPGLKTADFKGHVTVVNFFASWCMPCRAEHAYLLSLKGQGFTLIGIDYKNRPDDAKAWLTEMGDPYDAIGVDAQGMTAIDFGVYGVPETFVIDKKGIIRFKNTGPLTEKAIRERLLPEIKELSQ